MAPWNLQSLRASSSVLRYGLAVLCVALALGVALTFQHQRLPDVELPLFILAIAFIAWYAGVGPSVVAILLATMCFNYFFVEPIYSFYISSRELPYFFVFVICAILVTSFAAVRHRIEDDLRQTRDRLQIEVEKRTQQGRLLDLTHDSIFFRNVDGLITYWNRGAQELYGWTAEQAVGKRSQELLKAVFPAPIEVIDGKLLRTGVWEGELKHTRVDGAEVVVASRWSLSRDDRGQPIVMETDNDITERKHRDEEIRKLNQELAKRAAELEASNRELEAFSYSVSHDLRAPLRHVFGYSELLQKHAASLLDEKSRRYLQTILEATNRMGNLIDDLLAFSRISRAEAHYSIVSLEQIAREAVTEVHQDVNERSIVWKMNPLPECYGDRSMLRLALVNLISNAAKFTRSRPKAEIEIGCTEGKNDDLVLFVRDNGVGFDMKYSNKLFGVFQRLHPQGAFEGTGIGLATVQRIVHRHGGRIWAEGKVDCGATFYLSLSKTMRS